MTGQRSGKADPDCPKCEGRGMFKDGPWQMQRAKWKRCPCVDLRNDPAPPEVG